jgi:UDP-N-acetylmuramoyl-tripeptide--D-alanyl-D-alanine ligase
MLENILFLIVILAWIIAGIQYVIYTTNLFQQHEYDNRRFVHWGMTQFRKIARFPELILFPFLAAQLLIASAQISFYLGIFNQLLFIALLILTFIMTRRRLKGLVKPLVYTARAARLLVISILISLIEAYLLAKGLGCGPGQSAPTPCGGSLPVYLLALLWLGQVLAVNQILANLVLYPFDEFNRHRYLRSAAEKLDKIHPIVIGITGSYGKTSTKQILAEIMAEKYEVLNTPKSYNTLMGICKVINESLEAKHRYFIVEMGTYKKGEIEKICSLVKPQIGIITAIGPQHLERFLTLENIARAKYELIESLPRDGVAIFNYDNHYCRQLALQTQVKTLAYGIDSPEKVDLLAQNISVDMEGTKFEIVSSADPRRSARMQLLGRQNVSNALAAILAARECGIPLEQAVHTLVVLSPVEHRMQLIHTPQGVTLIDNAYSSNPTSARMSFEVLRALKCDGRKEQDREHYSLGQKAAQVSDLVFIVGDEKRVAPIRKGLLESGFSRECIHVCASMKETRAVMAATLKPGDLVLIENDLPDVY